MNGSEERGLGLVVRYGGLFVLALFTLSEGGLLQKLYTSVLYSG